MGILHITFKVVKATLFGQGHVSFCCSLFVVHLAVVHAHISGQVSTFTSGGKLLLTRADVCFCPVSYITLIRAKCSGQLLVFALHSHIVGAMLTGQGGV